MRSLLRSMAVARRRRPFRRGASGMLNEICDAIEAISSEKTLVFVFEDLHWADLSTLDLISALARRRQAARLLLLASYRPAEVSAGQHPLKRLKQDLVTHKLCTDVSLRPLERDAVREYLVQELQTRDAPQGAAQLCAPAF